MSDAVVEEKVVLVDHLDRQIGVAGKLAAHRDGLLHRAVSGFVFDTEGRLLVQQRAFGKYHSPGLWANTCCSHPRPGETSAVCMKRRLREELGCNAPMIHFGNMTYHADVGGDLTEYEYVHGFAGLIDGDITVNDLEVAKTDWLGEAELKEMLSGHRSTLCTWFARYLELGFYEIALRTAMR